MNTGIDLGSVTLSPNPMTTTIGVVATTTLIGVDPDHSTDLPSQLSHDRSSSSYNCCHDTPHCRPSTNRNTSEMTADLDIDLENNTTNWPEDLHPLHTLHPGNLRTGNINRSQLMTHHWNTIVQMTRQRL